MIGEGNVVLRRQRCNVPCAAKVCIKDYIQRAYGISYETALQIVSKKFQDSRLLLSEGNKIRVHNLL
jgi:hypothetical protein